MQRTEEIALVVDLFKKKRKLLNDILEHTSETQFESDLPVFIESLIISFSDLTLKLYINRS